jgi:hypothetical protein
MLFMLNHLMRRNFHAVLFCIVVTLEASGQYIPIHDLFVIGSGINSMSSSRLPRNFVHQFVVTFKNDSTVTADFNYNAERAIHSLTAFDVAKDQRFGPEVRPSDTKFIGIQLKRRMLTGIPKDSIWLFDIVKGKINGYSRIPFSNEDYSQIRFIQKGDGEIKKLTEENLKAMLADNRELLSSIKIEKLWRLIQYYNSSTPLKNHK